MTARTFHAYSRAICPECRRLVDAVRLIEDDRVILRKHCPEHGVSEALVSSDARWFQASLEHIKRGSIPLGFARPVAAGCPNDCGLCPDHEQHTCLPIVEITDHCNLRCPVCLVDNRHSGHLAVDAFARIVDGLVAREGRIETINLSGGEPTLHPQLLELVDLARRPEISRVSLSTNGVRLAEDPDLCRALAERDVYVNLQWDTLDAEALRRLRGPGDHLAIRERALANLEAAAVRTTLIATVAKGVNDQALGTLLERFLSNDTLLSLMLQPVAYTGQGRQFAPQDPLDRLTLPELIATVARTSGGQLLDSDFLPLPCSHPSCFALTYLLRTESGLIPFPRFVDRERYLALLANRGTLRPDAALEDTLQAAIDDLWSGADQIPDNQRILRALKGALVAMYPPEQVLALEQRLRLGEARVKTLFIHAFMDVHSFELERIKRCCTHYALPDGRLIPACLHNVLHRGEAT